jgi:phosphohistidine phosphatase
MKVLGLGVDLILTSPYLRARQTADIVAAEFDAEKKLELCSHLEVAGDPAALVAELQARSGSLERVLLVGHEPFLSELVSVLISGDERTEVMMKKGGLCKLTAEKISYGHCATLDWLLAPKQLTRIG